MDLLAVGEKTRSIFIVLTVCIVFYGMYQIYTVIRFRKTDSRDIGSADGSCVYCDSNSCLFSLLWYGDIRDCGISYFPGICLLLYMGCRLWCWRQLLCLMTERMYIRLHRYIGRTGNGIYQQCRSCL